MRTTTILILAIAIAIAAVSTSVLAIDDGSAFLRSTTSNFQPRCPNPPNTKPVYDSPPVLLRTTKNGKLYQGGSEATNDTFLIQHLFGEPGSSLEDQYYQMGFASGELNAKKIAPGINALYQWVDKQAAQKAPWIPSWLLDIIVNYGATIALEITWNTTVGFLPPKFVREMTGIAHGCRAAGCPATITPQDIFNVNALPSLIKAQCSAILANGAATLDSFGGLQVQLRTLDGMGGDTLPIKDDAVVTVYHPAQVTASVAKEPASATFGWLTAAFSVTGIGEYTSVGEKFWSATQYDKAAGLGWGFLIRELLTARNFTEAQNMIYNAPRTCSYHLAVASQPADAPTPTAALFYVSGDIVFETQDRSIDYPQHPFLKDLQYLDMFGQPTKSYCFGDMLTHLHGNITAEKLALDVAPRLGTGDLHAVTWDLLPHQKTAYFANARKTYDKNGPLKACHRTFTKLDMTKLFAETNDN